MKQNYTISIPKGLFWKLFVPGLAVFAAVGVLSGLIVIDRVIMPRVVGVSRDIVAVPNVVSLSVEAGREKLYKAGLLNKVKSKEYDATLAKGAIITQFPQADARVKKGRKIALVISKGKEMATVPDVRGLTERQARIELKNRGFVVGQVKKVFVNETPTDIVINAFPESGTTTSRELEVDIILSKGPKPTHADVPNLVGESIGTAKKKIAESGLVLGNVRYKNSPSLLPGTIISQSAAPGSRIPIDSKLAIVVSVIK